MNKNTTNTKAQSTNKSTSSCKSQCNQKTQQEPQTRQSQSKTQSKTKSSTKDDSTASDGKTSKCEFLSSLYRNLESAISSIEIILTKVDDVNLKQELQSQKKEYENLTKSIATQITQTGEIPKPNNILTKATTWSSIQVSTLLNTRTSHIADVMIKGTNQGILSLNKDKSTYSECMDTEAKGLASKVINAYESNIQTLNSYL